MTLQWCLNTSQLHLWCDNSSFVKTANRLLNGGTMRIGRDANDADLVYTFAHLIQPVRHLLKVDWVKGHQDISKLNSIPTEVHLNIEADKLASEAIASTPYCPTFEVSPASSVLLHIDDITITSKLRKAIMNKYNSNAIISRIFQRTGWSKSTFHSIFWEGLGRSLASFSLSPRFTLTKHTNALLPVGSLLEKRREKEPYRCFTCDSCACETSRHMFLCPGNEEWRKEASTNFSRFLKEYNIPKCTINMILSSFFGPIGGATHETTGIVTGGLSNIGWEELWRGKIPTSLILQCTSQETSSEGLSTDQRRWGTKFCTLVFSEVLSLWERRNRARHGGTESERTARSKEKLALRVRRVQDLARTLPGGADRTLLEADTDIDDWTPHRMQSFLAWAEELATFCTKENTSSAVRDRLSDEVRKPP